MLAAGADPDETARELLRRTDSPISAIKAIADGAGLSLADAKWVVHRNLAPRTREAAEELWSELIDAVARAGQRTHEPEPMRSDSSG